MSVFHCFHHTAYIILKALLTESVFIRHGTTHIGGPFIKGSTVAFLCCFIGCTADGTRLCTCGADGIIRLLDLASKSEIVSRESSDVFK